MANSITSENSNFQYLDQNETFFSRRKNYLNCGPSQKNRFKNMIIAQLNQVALFCNSIGLKINELVLSDNINHSNTEKTKITVLENNNSQKYKVFKCVMAKDLTNMSCRKYSLMKSTLKELNTIQLPGIKQLAKLQFALNNFFKIKSNDDGFFVEPKEKIIYACQKFLKRNPSFSSTKLRIKLSADSTSISKTHINVLNFTFTIVVDVENATSVFGANILGKIFMKKLLLKVHLFYFY